MLSEKAAVHLVCTEIRYREKHSLFLQNSKKHSVLCNIDGECLNLESALCMQMKLYMRSSFFALRASAFGSRNGGKYVTDSGSYNDT